MTPPEGDAGSHLLLSCRAESRREWWNRVSRQRQRWFGCTGPSGRLSGGARAPTRAKARGEPDQSDARVRQARQRTGRCHQPPVTRRWRGPAASGPLRPALYAAAPGRTRGRRLSCTLEATGRAACGLRGRRGLLRRSNPFSLIAECSTSRPRSGASPYQPSDAVFSIPGRNRYAPSARA